MEQHSSPEKKVKRRKTEKVQMKKLLISTDGGLCPSLLQEKEEKRRKMEKVQMKKLLISTVIDVALLMAIIIIFVIIIMATVIGLHLYLGIKDEFRSWLFMTISITMATETVLTIYAMTHNFCYDKTTFIEVALLMAIIIIFVIIIMATVIGLHLYLGIKDEFRSWLFMTISITMVTETALTIYAMTHNFCYDKTTNKALVIIIIFSIIMATVIGLLLYFGIECKITHLAAVLIFMAIAAIGLRIYFSPKDKITIMGLWIMVAMTGLLTYFSPKDEITSLILLIIIFMVTMIVLIIYFDQKDKFTNLDLLINIIIAIAVIGLSIYFSPKDKITNLTTASAVVIGAFIIYFLPKGLRKKLDKHKPQDGESASVIQTEAKATSKQKYIAASSEITSREQASTSYTGDMDDLQRAIQSRIERLETTVDSELEVDVTGSKSDKVEEMQIVEESKDNKNSPDQTNSEKLSSRLEVTKLETSDMVESKSNQVHIIGPKGDNIELDGCRIHFPDRTFECEATVSVSVKINSSDLPDDQVAISPELNIVSNLPLLRQATIQLPIWCVKDDSPELTDVTVKVLHKPDGSEKWKTITTLPLTQSRMIKFQCQDFSPVTVIQSIWDYLTGRTNLVLTGLLSTKTKVNEDFLSFCLKNKTIEKELKKELTDMGCETIRPLNTMHIKKGDHLTGHLKSQLPGIVVHPENGYTVPADEDFATIFEKCTFTFALKLSQPIQTDSILMECSISKNHVKDPFNQHPYYHIWIKAAGQTDFPSNRTSVDSSSDSTNAGHSSYIHKQINIAHTMARDNSQAMVSLEECSNTIAENATTSTDVPQA